jgi:uncharacterized membrane protein YfcA
VDPALIVAGALTGLIVGITGVGGGALMTPILLLVFGIAPQAAIGTDLWYAAITKVMAARVHQRHGLIDWVVVGRLWAGSLTASAATVWWMREVGHGLDVGFLKAAIAIAVCVTAVGMLFSGPLSRLGVAFDRQLYKRFQARLTVVVGAVLGVVVTLTSVGAGALGAVCLLYLYPSRLTPARLVATDIAHAIPLAIVAGVGHLTLANVDGMLLMNLCVGSVPAAFIGARLSARMPHHALRLALAIVLFVVGAQLLRQVLA